MSAGDARGRWSSMHAAVYPRAMTTPQAIAASRDSGWTARLELGFEARAARTELVHRRHIGPLVVQKALHPEGDSPCHAIVLHPPSGLVGGDSLALEVTVASGAAALLTTPGASKWYRSLGATADSTTDLRVAAGAALEYLPREAIVYDGAVARAELRIELAGDARLMAWDLWCLGRTHAGERFDTGRLETRVLLRIDGREALYERAVIDGGSALLRRSAALAGAPVYGTMLCVGPPPDAAELALCRAIPVREGRGALTVLPRVLCARYLGHSSEAAHGWFTALWSRLRPVMLGRAAVPPRIWAV